MKTPQLEHLLLPLQLYHIVNSMKTDFHHHPHVARHDLLEEHRPQLDNLVALKLELSLISLLKRK